MVKQSRDKVKKGLLMKATPFIFAEHIFYSIVRERYLLLPYKSLD